MSEILQNVHSLAVTNEVIKQRSREGLRNAFLHFLAPGSFPALPSHSLIEIMWKAHSVAFTAT